MSAQLSHEATIPIERGITLAALDAALAALRRIGATDDTTVWVVTGSSTRLRVVLPIPGEEP